MRLAPFVATLMFAAPAHAQVTTWPADGAYIPLACDNAPMTDRFADESGALAERDIVGDAAAPAGLRASDATHLYVRMRLEDDPAPGGALRPFSWGMELDLDGTLSTYELLILVDGIGGGGHNVYVFRNTTTTSPNDPNDSADQPAAVTLPFAMYGRSVTAAGTTYGSDADFFLDFAVPWSMLTPLGLDRETTTSVWAATSSSPNSLNGDFACHDGTAGAPQLDGTVSDPTTGDPTLDPNPPGDGRLEGGGGCAATGGAGPLVALMFLRRRRRVR